MRIYQNLGKFMPLWIWQQLYIKSPPRKGRGEEIFFRRGFLNCTGRCGSGKISHWCLMCWRKSLNLLHVKIVISFSKLSCFMYRANFVLNLFSYFNQQFHLLLIREMIQRSLDLDAHTPGALAQQVFSLYLSFSGKNRNNGFKNFFL